MNTERIGHYGAVGHIYGREHILAEVENALRKLEANHEVDWSTIEIHLEPTGWEEFTLGGDKLFQSWHDLQAEAQGLLRDGGDEVGLET